MTIRCVAMLAALFALSPLFACGDAGSDIAVDLAAESRATFQPYTFSDVVDALGGTIPFPADKLALALRGLETESTITAAILPHGRSLERTVTDFRAPRSLMLWLDSGSYTAYPLFIGNTPNAEELEILAWNWQTRQYDFFLVQDYAAGKTPRVTVPQRPLCMACHQDGGPIFPVRPWNETTLNTTIQHELATQAADPLSRYLLALPAAGANRITLDPSGLDLGVRDATIALQDQKIFANACGGDLECRKGLLLTALSDTIDGFADVPLSSAQKAKMRTAMQRVWPSDNFAIQDDGLADRTVDLTAPLRFESAQDPLVWRSPTHARSPDQAVGVSPRGAYADCFYFTPDQTQTLRSWGVARVKAAMETEQMTTLVTTWPPTESAIVSALSHALSAPRPIGGVSSVPWAPPADPPPVGHGAGPNETTAALFDNYCGYCHGGPSSRPPLLPLSDLAALGRYVGSAGRTVKGLLDPAHPVMPPHGAAQPTDAERQRMISGLSQP
jgi:hypothetical protein